jgi:hypothetical protein
MRIIQLDGKDWKTPVDFLQALFEGIEQGYPHGLSIDAFVDSMIWGGMGGIEPPYTVQVVNVGGAPKAVVDEVIALSSAISEARIERRTRDGADVDVAVQCPELKL